MNDTIITIIIATYNKPSTLEVAIKSVINQTLNNWKLLVIGDNCDECTRETLEKIIDPRIKYINLVNHFGEQSGPNSVGLSLVKTPFLAYLNHGDIWLPDHLEIAIHTLKSGKYKFYMGGTAYSRFIDNTKEQPELVVDEINIENRSPSDPFFRKTSKYEPASSWILSRMTAEKIGLWNYYTDLYRVPTEDYLLRAWRSKCKFYFSTTVTTWVIVPQSIIDESIKSVNSGN